MIFAVAQTNGGATAARFCCDITGMIKKVVCQLSMACRRAAIFIVAKFENVSETA
jgi:hypothetical protein